MLWGIGVSSGLRAFKQACLPCQGFDPPYPLSSQGFQPPCQYMLWHTGLCLGVKSGLRALSHYVYTHHCMLWGLGFGVD